MAKKSPPVPIPESPPAGGAAPGPVAVDWERIEIDFRAGVKSLREIAEGSGTSHVNISKRAKKSGWVREVPSRNAPVILGSQPDPLAAQGFVYVIYINDSAGQAFYKIGFAAHFQSRFTDHQCASPFDICVACAYFVGNMRAEEKYLHQRFAVNRVRGEWFRLSIADLKEIAARSLLIAGGEHAS